LYDGKLRNIDLAVLYDSDANQTAIGEQPPAGVARFIALNRFCHKKTRTPQKGRPGKRKE
jgi:hypothetical protein